LLNKKRTTNGKPIGGSYLYTEGGIEKGSIL